MLQSTNPNSTQLRRDIGLLEAVGVGLGAVFGAGIFVVTGIAAQMAGPSLLIGLFLAGIAATFNGLSSAQLAAACPQSGGTYEYGHRFLTPWAGFAAGWMFLASKLAAAGLVAAGFGIYLTRWFPNIPIFLVAPGITLLLTVANIFGIRKAGRLNLAIVGVTLVALLTFIIGGITSFNPRNLQPFAPNGPAGIAGSAALMFFAFTGYARLATLGEEVRDPRRTIPRAIIITLVISMIVYMAVASVALGAVGADALAAAPAPLHTAAAAFSLPIIQGIVSIGAGTALLGVLLSQIQGISRMMLAMARRNDLPAFLGHISATHAVPIHALWMTGGIVAILGTLGSPGYIAATASFTILLYYAITNMAALKMPGDQRLYSSWIARAGLVTCLVFALSLSFRVILVSLTLLAAGFLLRAFFKQRTR
jgi:basic amino acid/polyamine antiporter, APA family